MVWRVISKIHAPVPRTIDDQTDIPYHSVDLWLENLLYDTGPKQMRADWRASYKQLGFSIDTAGTFLHGNKIQLGG